MASKRKECSIENYFKKNWQQMQESVVAVALNTSGPEYSACASTTSILPSASTSTAPIC